MHRLFGHPHATTAPPRVFCLPTFPIDFFKLLYNPEKRHAHREADLALFEDQRNPNISARNSEAAQWMEIASHWSTLVLALRLTSNSSSAHQFARAQEWYSRIPACSGDFLGFTSRSFLPRLTRKKTLFFRSGVPSGSMKAHNPGRGPTRRALLSPKMGVPKKGGHQIPYCTPADVRPVRNCAPKTERTISGRVIKAGGRRGRSPVQPRLSLSQQPNRTLRATLTLILILIFSMDAFTNIISYFVAEQAVDAPELPTVNEDKSSGSSGSCIVA
ncbi:hypothetical protein C8R44DRAFT_724538 [Mycena epipterygia]|nr:hypothetical protein C8R44DRAFT_724538 [Mycena epipterygia]